MIVASVLVVDDDTMVAEVVVGYLQRAGHAVVSVADGPAALGAVREAPPDLIVLDLMLPGIDGLEVCRRVRADHPDLPVIMLTALGEEEDRIAGLEVGADDYVAKPFDLRELRARVKSVIRRMQARPQTAPAAQVPGAAAPSSRVRVGACALDLASHQLFASDGNELPLTGMEFDLLRVFLERPNQVLNRDQLLTLTRNREWEPFDRSIDIRIARVRRKIEHDPEHPQAIRTVRGVGYMFVPTTDAS